MCGSARAELPADGDLLPNKAVEALNARPSMMKTSADMRLWILGDLHMETVRGWDLPPPAERPEHDVVVIPGDLFTRMERGVRWIRERLTDREVIYVHGNHECWGTDVDITVEKALRAAEGTNVHVLQNRAITIGNTIFAGCCGWTDFNLFGDQRRGMRVAGDHMNDYRRIRKSNYKQRFLPQDALARHVASRAFLEGELRKSRSDDQKMVIVTHHAPMPEIGFRIAPHQPGEAISDETMLGAAFRSDLTALMHPQPAEGDKEALRPAQCWVFGHTHETAEVLIGETLVVSNSKGYGPWAGERWENPFFRSDFVVEI
ncbi:metallophosphoesterase [Bradyrhizobium yuanmingense]|uniref:metallophosphoesterase n=1 Tax=Bradyrhizobium yuanmingense TaxID=108015 RepID=UPI003516023C